MGVIISSFYTNFYPTNDFLKLENKQTLQFKYKLDNTGKQQKNFNLVLPISCIDESCIAYYRQNFLQILILYISMLLSLTKSIC